MSWIILHSLVHSLTLFNEEKAIVTGSSLHQQKNDININNDNNNNNNSNINNNNDNNNKGNWLCMFLLYESNPPM